MKSDNVYWQSRAVTWLLRESKAKDVESYMKEEATKLLAKTNQHDPPFNPERIAFLKDIKDIEDAQIKNISELVPIKGGCSIRINPQAVTGYKKKNPPTNGLSLRSRRFTIAHEIGHTYFYQTTSKIPLRPFGDYGSDGEERLCDVFATELLMPEQRFIPDTEAVYRRKGNYVETILTLSSLYKVTPQPIVIRLYELGILDRARHVVIKWNYMINPNKPEENKTKLRIGWSYPYTFPYIPKFKPAPIGSAFEKASRTKDVILERSSVKIGGINGIYHIEAISSYRENSGSENEIKSNPVLSLIHLVNPTTLAGT